jgi:hypothetical protein
MKCKDIERMVIASSGGLPDSKQLDGVRLHVEHCGRCARLIEDMESLRSLLQRRAEPELPGDLDRKTYLKCLSEMQSLQKNKEKINLQQQLQSIPVYMKAVFIALFVVTIIWIFPFFKDFGFAGESLSFSTILGLFFIIQNAMMILFAPLLIQRFRSKKINIQFFQ